MFPPSLQAVPPPPSEKLAELPEFFRKPESSKGDPSTQAFALSKETEEEEADDFSFDSKSDDGLELELRVKD